MPRVARGWLFAVSLAAIGIALGAEVREDSSAALIQQLRAATAVRVFLIGAFDEHRSLSTDIDFGKKHVATDSCLYTTDDPVAVSSLVDLVSTRVIRAEKGPQGRMVLNVGIEFIKQDQVFNSLYFEPGWQEGKEAAGIYDGGRLAVQPGMRDRLEHWVTQPGVRLDRRSQQLCTRSDVDGLLRSRNEKNIPPADQFNTLLLRDLTVYFTNAEKVPGVTVKATLLRETPFQPVDYPTYYLWVEARSRGHLVREGALRAAAIERSGFRISNFASREKLQSALQGANADDAAMLTVIFPEELLPAIQEHVNESAKK